MRLCIFGIVLTAAAICGLLSCSDSPAEEQLASAESVMDRCPDSALSILRGIDLALIHGNREKALYGLLYTQALDKNHEPIQDDSLIRFAVRYFTNIKDKRRSMIANNYRGRVQYMNGEYASGLASFFKAYELANELDDDFWIGMTARGISDTYSEAFNNSEELAYAQKEYEHILQSGRQPYINYAMLDLARAYCRSRMYEDAIRIAEQATDSAVLYSDPYLYSGVMQIIGISYMGQGNNTQALSAFSSLVNSGLAEPEDSMYLAIANISDGHTLEGLRMLDSVLTPDSLRRTYAKYKAFKKLGRNVEALREMELFDSLSNVVFRHNMDRNLTGSLVAYLDMSKQVLESDLKAARMMTWILIAIVLSVIVVTGVIVFYVHAKQKKALDDKILFAEHLQELLRQSKNENTKAASVIRDLLTSKYGIIEQFCAVVINSGNSKSAKSKIADSVTTIIDSLSINGDKIAELEAEVNALYDNLFADFRKDLPSLKDVDYRLYLFSILGFSNTAISLFLKEDRVSAVYDRKRHLKDRIKRLDPLKRDRYLSIFQYPFSFCQTISGICDITY